MALHVIGAAVTAAAFGAALGALGSLLGAPWGRAGAVGVALVAVVYALAELPRVTVAVPQLQRQVPDWWRTYFGPSVASFLYGAGLGVGVLTYLAHGTLVVVAAAAVAIGDPALGAAIVGAFGLARGAAIVASRSITSEELGAAVLDRLVARSDDLRRWANATVLVVIAALAALAAAQVSGGWALLTSAVVAATFAWSATSKVVAPRRWFRALEGHALPATVTRVARWAVPMAEVSVPTLALLGLRRASAVVAIGLLVVFSIAVVRARLRIGPAVPCGCFGERGAAAASAQLLRNAALAAAAAFAATSAPDAAVVRWPGAPGVADVVPAMLAAGSVAVAVWAAWRSTAWLARGRA
ncbi:MAG TPA: MauE/DoxX family redox-associated membrane protein [Actinomycetota bacterium]|nr:MauE/DoxX family redox-associated membrane protein [Actinomycetota bacterium]